MDKEPEIGGASGWPFERVCPECGKVFAGTLLEAWIYKDRDEVLCSWNCKRRRERKRYEAEMRAQAAKRAVNLKPEQKEKLIRTLICRGLTNKEIAMRTGLSEQNVNYYRRKIEGEAKG